MDIFELLNNKAYGQYVLWAVAIGLFILYIIGRMIYFVLFPSKRPGHTKSFKDEAEENRNKPISNSESIGSVSTRLGEDLRDVWEKGYSDEQVNDVLIGKYTLEDMYKMGPSGNTKSLKGREILESKERST